MNSISLLSPAKVNLFLKVLNKRRDGFHDIVTVFERINLSDEISFKLNTTGAIRIYCSHPQVPCGSKNLIYRAARMLREDFKISKGVDIHLKKNIPVAAGLGGGSSNAATALKGLNRLWKLDLALSQLLPYACQLGSDVSFFMYDCSWALGIGRGDCIQKMVISTKLWHVLVVPCIKLYSGDIYKGLRMHANSCQMSQDPGRYGGLSIRERPMKMLTKNSDDATIFIRCLRQADVTQIGQGLVNDLEAVVARFFPSIGKLQQRLKSLDVQGVMVSGSGPCVFAITKTQGQANAIQKILAKRFSRTFVVRTF